MPLTAAKLEPVVLASQPTTEGTELRLRIDADLATLDGHFPGLPIVPGVCLLDWVVRFSARHLALLEDGAPQFQIKFRHVLQPGREVMLSLRKLSGGRVQFSYAAGVTIYASGIASPGDP